MWFVPEDYIKTPLEIAGNHRLQIHVTQQLIPICAVSLALYIGHGSLNFAAPTSCRSSGWFLR
jgi:hypothetical protein